MAASEFASPASRGAVSRAERTTGPLLRLTGDWDAAEIARLENLLGCLEANPQSNLYPRQLPVAGIDSKWLEARMALIADLVAALQAGAGGEMDSINAAD
jgi:hypothetical protein